MSEAIGRDDWTPLDKEVALLICARCGCAVPSDRRDLHFQWHYETELASLF